MSWKCEVHADGEWVSNGLRFATEKEANDYGIDLRSRWFVPDNHRAVKSDEPVTHCWDSKRGLGTILPEVQED